MENIKIWLKKNLFSNWYYSLITIFILYVLFSTIPTFLDWAFFKATFIGNTKSDCKSGGACWVFIKLIPSQESALNSLQNRPKKSKIWEGVRICLDANSI